MDDGAMLGALSSAVERRRCGIDIRYRRRRAVRSRRSAAAAVVIGLFAASRFAKRVDATA